MANLFAYIDVSIVINVGIFVATMVFSQKIKDFFSGVPSDLRSSLSSIETSVKADVKNYTSGLVAKIAPAPAPVVKAPVAPPAPAAPAA
jgi:hypothetical protein